MLGVGWTSVQRPSPPLTSGERSHRQTGRGPAETPAALTALQIGPRWADRHRLGGFGASSSSVPGPFVLISLGPVLRTVAARVLGNVWSSCS